MRLRHGKRRVERDVPNVAPMVRPHALASWKAPCRTRRSKRRPHGSPPMRLRHGKRRVERDVPNVALMVRSKLASMRLKDDSSLHKLRCMRARACYLFISPKYPHPFFLSKPLKSTPCHLSVAKNGWFVYTNDKKTAFCYATNGNVANFAAVDTCKKGMTHSTMRTFCTHSAQNRRRKECVCPTLPPNFLNIKLNK